MLRARFGVSCFLGLTATATQETVSNIATHLNLQDSSKDCVKGTILPPNLNLSVSKDCLKEQVCFILHVFTWKYLSTLTVTKCVNIRCLQFH